MFKKLRNRLLITNLAITSALVICCLGAIYLTTYSFIAREINIQLDRTVLQSVQRMNHPMDERNKYEPPDNMGRKRPDDQPRDDRFRAEFSVYADKDGNVIEVNTNFNMVEADYSGVAEEIIRSARSEGSTQLYTDSWAYRVVPYADGYIIAFVQNSSQKRILLMLIIILVLAAILSTAITFFISLFSANRSIRPIEEAYNKQKQFVSDASHELRTPLASISANADVLLSKPDSTIADERKWLQYIKDETERMTQLTNDLLYLARSDYDKGEKELSEISFSDIADDVILENEAIAFEAGVLLDSEIAGNIRIKGVQASLKQLVLILVDNAIKYTPQGGKIKATLKKQGDKAVFTVENTGEINAEDLTRLFERFYRADKSRARESGGYGLGLAIAKSITESFGGTIGVTSENNKTEFTVTVNSI